MNLNESKTGSFWCIVICAAATVYMYDIVNPQCRMKYSGRILLIIDCNLKFGISCEVGPLDENNLKEIQNLY